MTYRLFSALTGILISLVLYFLVRKSRVSSLYTTWWVVIIISILLLAFFPGILDFVGNLFGVSYPPVLLTVFGLAMILVKVLTMDIYITKNEARYKELAQKLATLELMVKENTHEKKEN